MMSVSPLHVTVDLFEFFLQLFFIQPFEHLLGDFGILLSTLEDFLDQMEAMNKMGGVEGILSMLPGAGKLKNLNFDEKELVRQKAIIQSMTIKERQNPSIINASRRKRIAAGSGTRVSDVNRLLQGFEQSRKLMKQINSGRFKMPGMGRKFPFM